MLTMALCMVRGIVEVLELSLSRGIRRLSAVRGRACVHAFAGEIQAGDLVKGFRDDVSDHAACLSFS